MLEEPRASWGPAAVHACWAQQSEAVSADLPLLLLWGRLQTFLSTSRITVMKHFQKINVYLSGFILETVISVYCSAKRNWSYVLKLLVDTMPMLCFITLFIAFCAQMYAFMLLLSTDLVCVPVGLGLKMSGKTRNQGPCERWCPKWQAWSTCPQEQHVKHIRSCGTAELACT